ncbi:Galactose mutarotase-like superfamily protein [Raphanus sativus]|nr:Galactose mutarotase-like superfamily protein [Raphanus sativus]
MVEEAATLPLALIDTPEKTPDTPEETHVLLIDQPDETPVFTIGSIRLGEEITALPSCFLRRQWILRWDSSALVDLIIRSSQDDLKIWPHKVALGHRGDLTLTSRVTNTDVKPFNFTFALHPYFSVSDISQIQVEGLHGLNYLDQQKNRTRFTDHDKAITFNSQLDRLYLNTPNKNQNRGPQEKEDNRVVWNPWEKKVSDLGVEDYRRFVAVESAAVHKPIILEPGKEWKGILQVSVVPSS